MHAFYTHLNSRLKNADGSTSPYYIKSDVTAVNTANENLEKILQEAKDNYLITNAEYDAMLPEGKKLAKFYCTFKVHKEHKHGEAPPERPIVSGCGATFENANKFIEHHIKHIATTHPTYLQDTPDFLRYIEEINHDGELPDNAILVTFDVVGLFTNIPEEAGLEALREALMERTAKDIPTEFLVRLMQLILQNNFFKFNNEIWKQEIGASMGSKPIPSYANIFMAKKIDNKIKELALKHTGTGISPMKILKRFLDDLFSIWCGTSKSLHKLLQEMCKINTNIKFTIKHTKNEHEAQEDRCECSPESSIPFLDTSLSIQHGKIEVDLYKKPSDRNQYLLTSSCHPPDCLTAIPYSLALRINRICTDTNKRNMRLQELKELLLERQYKSSIIDAAIKRAIKIPRSEAIKKVAKQTNNKRPVFAVTWDPRMPNLSKMQKKHWRSMTSQDPYLREAFPQPPLLAYKRQKNISDFLIRAKVPEIPRIYPKRKINGMKKCNKPCLICPYIMKGKTIKGDTFTWNISNEVNCHTQNIVYLIECNIANCKKRYIGETHKELHDRICEHLGYIRTKKLEKPTGNHFNSPGHSMANMTVTILEKVRKTEWQYRKEREKYLIRKFNTYYCGLNLKPN